MVLLPLQLKDLKTNLQNFPARHGVSFGRFEGTQKIMPEFARMLVSLHHAFGDFHRTVNQPADTTWSSAERILERYGEELVSRVEAGKRALLIRINNCSSDPAVYESLYECLCDASLVLDLVHATVVAQNFPAGRMPQWVVRHGGIDAELIVEQVEVLLEEMQSSGGNMENKTEKKFWSLITTLAFLDCYGTISDLIERYLELVDFEPSTKPSPLVSLHSIQLVGAFCRELPSLGQIAADRTLDSSTFLAVLEKRRSMASVASHKSAGEKPLALFWALQTADEEDWDTITAGITRMQVPRAGVSEPTSLSWHEQLALAWAWMHPLDEPGEGLAALARDLLESNEDLKKSSASIIDACMFSLFSGDLLNFAELIVNCGDELFGGPWCAALAVDLLFFIHPPMGKLRTVCLMDYCRYLSDGRVMAGLGARIAADIASTLDAGAELFIGKCGHLARNFSEWSAALVLARDSPNHFGETMCMERFHKLEHELVDAVHVLVMAAELGQDIHLGACRLSDFLDQLNGTNDFTSAHTHSLGALPATGLLPEYMECGRFDFLTSLVKSRSMPDSEEKINSLVALIASPNCPPERVIELVSELKLVCDRSGAGLSVDNGIAVINALEDSSRRLERQVTQNPSVLVEPLMAWTATLIAHAGLHSSC